MLAGHGDRRWLLIILAYGLVAMAWHINYNSVYHDEALNILMGRQILNGMYCPGCAQNTGSVIIQPIIASLGDQVGGLYGARAMGIPFGLGLTIMIYLAAKEMFSEFHGLVSAMLLLFTGTTIYLSKLATYDIISAFFMGLSFYLIVAAEKKSPGRNPDTLIFTSSVALFLSAMTKYVAAVFILPLCIYVIWKRGFGRSLCLFVFPVLFLTVTYILLALYPVKGQISGSSLSTYEMSQIPLRTLASWTFRWLAMPYLLAVFGMFHEKYGKAAIVLFILSTPIVLLHLLSGAEQSVNKNVIFSIIFLTPAAAIGVDHMGHLFSAYSTSTWVKPLFTGTILVVIWAFGISELRWLEGQYPDMRPVIKYLERSDGRPIKAVIDSDYGDAIYTYRLGAKMPGSLFIPFTEYQDKGEYFYGKPDYVIIDEYYGKPAIRKAAEDFVKTDYVLERAFDIELSWGTDKVDIFRRR